MNNDQPDWSESLYFNFYDENNDMTAFMRIGNKPNRNEKSMFFFLMTPELTAGTRAAVPCDDRPWENNGLSFTALDSGGWSITFNGPVFDMSTGKPVPVPIDMEVEWGPCNDEMDYRACVDAKGVALSAEVASEHYEQFGRVKGLLEIGDALHFIDGSGERDKSVGVRDWGSPEMWMWINSRFSDNEAFNVTKLVTGKGDVDAGYFHTGGHNRPLNRAKIDVKMEGGVPVSFSMELKGSCGSPFAVEGRVIRHAELPFTGSKDMKLIESISECTWDGKTGFGIAEFLVPAVKRDG